MQAYYKSFVCDAFYLYMVFLTSLQYSNKPHYNFVLCSLNKPDSNCFHSYLYPKKLVLDCMFLGQAPQGWHTLGTSCKGVPLGL